MERLKVLEKHLLYLKHATNADDAPLPPSFLGPDAYWTSDEKALFFKSIARHSRWRPDSIAEDLGGTKSVSDVCTYIQLLEEGSTQHSFTVPSDYLPQSAREVSDKWIAIEEELANEIISNETEWSHHTKLKSRRDHIHALKNSLGDTVGDPPSEAVPDLQSFVDRKKNLKRSWAREDFLSTLTLRSLKNMDILLHSSDHNLLPQEKGSNGEKNQVLPERTKAFSLKIRSTSIPDILDEKALHLSPVSRERLRKRLWTRRKRAVENGMSPSKASNFLGKLKRGRRLSSSGPSDEHAGTPENLEGENFRTTNSTETYQNDIFKCYDISRRLLVSDGLDIFHLKKFAVLSGLYQRVYSSEQTGLDDDFTIAYDTLCYMRISLIHFLVSVIVKAIAHRRADIRQRRINEDNPDIDEIRRENVLASLFSLGQVVDKDGVFARLYTILQSRDQSGSSSDEGNQIKTPGSVRTGEPCLIADESTTCFASCMPMWIDDENTLDENLDEKSLAKELAAEETLEQRFKLADRKFENRLWMGIGQDEVVETTELPQGRYSLRFRPPGGLVQSDVFVDSDEDVH